MSDLNHLPRAVRFNWDYAAPGMPVGTFPRSNMPAIFAQTGSLNRNGTSTAIDRTSDNMLWMMTR